MKSFPLILLLAAAASGGVPHAGGGSHKEREADGAYSPRDGKHGTGGDHHDGNFDHEAILGNLTVQLNVHLWYFDPTY